MLSAGTLAALILTAGAAGMEHTAAPVVGVILSLAFLVASIRQKAPHFLVLAGVALALGLAFATVGLGWGAMNWMFVWLGMAAAAIGGWRFRRYVKHHPLEQQS